MTEGLIGLFIGLILGISGMAYSHTKEGSYSYAYKREMKQCERELPRHQSCVMVYAPIVEIQE